MIANSNSIDVQEMDPRNKDVSESKKRIKGQSTPVIKVYENSKTPNEPHNNSKKSKSDITCDSNNKERSKKSKKTDVNLSDLMAVDDFIKLDSPLSHKGDQMTKEGKLQDVCLDDLLNANSLPVSMKDGDFDNLLEKESKKDDYKENHKCNSPHISQIKNEDDPLIPNKGNSKGYELNRSKIKIIEDFKQSANSTQKSSKLSHDSDSSLSLIGSQNNILYKDDEKLEPETDLLTKNISNLRLKSLNNPASRKGLLLPSNRVNLNINIGNSNFSRERIEDSHKSKGNSKNLTGSIASNISKRSITKGIHTDSMINSNNIKLLLNYNEHENEVHIPMIRFGEKSEPIILPLKMSNVFSKMVDTTEKTIAHDILNMTFPQYNKKTTIEVKYKAIKFPKKLNNLFSTKSIDTLDTAAGFRNLNIISGKVANGNIKEPVKSISIKNYNGAKNENKFFSPSKLNFLKI